MEGQEESSRNQQERGQYYVYVRGIKQQKVVYTQVLYLATQLKSAPRCIDASASKDVELCHGRIFTLVISLHRLRKGSISESANTLVLSE